MEGSRRRHRRHASANLIRPKASRSCLMHRRGWSASPFLSRSLCAGDATPLVPAVALLHKSDEFQRISRQWHAVEGAYWHNVGASLSESKQKRSTNENDPMFATGGGLTGYACAGRCANLASEPQIGI